MSELPQTIEITEAELVKLMAFADREHATRRDQIQSKTLDKLTKEAEDLKSCTAFGGR